MKRIKRDDTEHGYEYYWADEVDALLAQQKRPQNCGTGHCSCIECVVEPAQRPIKTYCGGKPWPVAPKIGCVNHDCDQCKTAREPLTNAQMWSIWNQQGDDAMEQQAAIAFARAIEAAHGIKGAA